MYYSGITLFKETHDFAKINLCFAFSCVQMPTVISVIRLTVLVKGPTKSYYTQYIYVWSLFCLIPLYVGLHFLWFLLEN